VALRKQRVPARFVRYPDTAHGGWTPWNTLHRYREELRFWDEYLAAPRGTPAP
jgi:dipeptidyl aminopeptidase/acylaminoacyl peptidase